MTSSPLLATLRALLLVAIGLSGSLAKADDKKADPPNIVIIFADDLGYGDLSSYGATKIDTPNIDRLAQEGMKFTDAHAAASVCSPSRYGLLTGRSPWRLGKTGNGYRLAPDQLNLASMLGEEGYTSAAIGKWHLGYSKNWNQPPITGPLEKGFDYHFGVPSNHNDSTRVFIENNDIYRRTPGEEYRFVEGEPLPKGVDHPRVEDQVDTTLTKKAVEFIERNAEHPFFLYFTPCCPHTHITPAEPFRGTSEAGLLGDYIQELDSHVGTLLAKLKELELEENTLVIFTSDNGGSPKDFRGTHGMVLNLASTAGGILDKYKTAKVDARKMGHITNGPFQDGKGHPQEGGHRVPFIARWPGHIEQGSVSDYTFPLTDLVATAAELVGTELPEDAAEDSFSLLPVLLGKPSPHEREAIFIQGDTKDNAIAVCSGQWKLIEWKKDDVRKLYDLHADPGETNDLAESHPDKVQHLSNLLAEAREAGRTRPTVDGEKM
ncbi:MAG: arylsulfatase [Verrucomicrobiota bacterium JB023]|nr:arylsulfatase [Verrucomicrobiota bacterium JB023]